jgi:hypothetical protein
MLQAREYGAAMKRLACAWCRAGALGRMSQAEAFYDILFGLGILRELHYKCCYG